jgi:hypothetical protein
MLLYLVKYSRPDISNSIRELTQVLYGANLVHWKRSIKYIDTKMLALKVETDFQ